MQLYMFGSPPVVAMTPAPSVVVETFKPARLTAAQRRRGSAPVEASPAVEQVPVVEPVKAPRASREKLPAKPVVEQTMWAVYTGPVMDVAPVGQKPEILPAESADEAVRVVSAWKENRGGPRWALPWTEGDAAVKVVELEAVAPAVVDDRPEWAPEFIAIEPSVEPASAESRWAVFVAVDGDVQPPPEFVHAPAASTACRIVANRLGIAEDRCLALSAKGFENAPVAKSAPTAAAPVEPAAVAPASVAPRASSKASRRAAVASEPDTRTPDELLVELRDELASALGVTGEPPTLTAIVINDVAHINCDGVPVPLEGVLDRLRRTDRVTHTMLAEAAREVLAGTPISDNRSDAYFTAMKLSARRSDLDMESITQGVATLCGESVQSLEARYAKLAEEQAQEKADAKAAQKAGRRWSEKYGWKAPPDGAPVEGAVEQPINDAAARDAQYIADCADLTAEQRQYERDKKPVHAPAPKRAGRGSKASPIVTAPAGPADVAAQSMRRLTDRQIELVRKVNVVNGRAIYGTGSEEHIENWDDLKSTMLALDGAWQKANKKKQIPGGFTFPEGVDVEETIRLAQTTGEVLDPKLAGFFATPVEHAKSLADRLGIQPGWRVLEPSAGTGRLAVAARDLGALLECVEPLPKNREALTALGFTLIGADIMALDPIADAVDNRPFDACLMNPPFDHELDHVRHAGRFVEPGGPVASIMSGGLEFRTTKDAIAFRAFLTAHGGTIEAMHEGSFLESGTGVRTVIVEYKACAGCRAGTCVGR